MKHAAPDEFGDDPWHGGHPGRPEPVDSDWQRVQHSGFHWRIGRRAKTETTPAVYELQILDYPEYFDESRIIDGVKFIVDEPERPEVPEQHGEARAGGRWDLDGDADEVVVDQFETREQPRSAESADWFFGEAPEDVVDQGVAEAPEREAAFVEERSEAEYADPGADLGSETGVGAQGGAEVEPGTEFEAEVEPEFEFEADPGGAAECGAAFRARAEDDAGVERGAVFEDGAGGEPEASFETGVEGGAGVESGASFEAGAEDGAGVVPEASFERGAEDGAAPSARWARARRLKARVKRRCWSRVERGAVFEADAEDGARGEFEAGAEPGAAFEAGFEAGDGGEVGFAGGAESVAGREPRAAFGAEAEAGVEAGFEAGVGGEAAFVTGVEAEFEDEAEFEAEPHPVVEAEADFEAGVGVEPDFEAEPLLGAGAQPQFQTGPAIHAEAEPGLEGEPAENDGEATSIDELDYDEPQIVDDAEAVNEVDEAGDYVGEGPAEPTAEETWALEDLWPVDTVGGAAEQIISELAPDELIRFPVVAHRFFHEESTRRRVISWSLGGAPRNDPLAAELGGEKTEELVTGLVLTALTCAATGVLTEVGTRHHPSISRWRRNRQAARRPLVAGPFTQLPHLGSFQVAAAGQVIEEAAEDAGFDPDRARRLSILVLSALTRARH